MRREIAIPPHSGQRPARTVALWTPWGVMPRDDRQTGQPEEKPRRQPALRSRPAASGMAPARGRTPLA